MLSVALVLDFRRRKSLYHVIVVDPLKNMWSATARPVSASADQFLSSVIVGEGFGHQLRGGILRFRILRLYFLLVLRLIIIPLKLRSRTRPPWVHPRSPIRVHKTYQSPPLMRYLHQISDRSPAHIPLEDRALGVWVIFITVYMVILILVVFYAGSGGYDFLINVVVV